MATSNRINTLAPTNHTDEETKNVIVRFPGVVVPFCSCGKDNKVISTEKSAITNVFTTHLMVFKNNWI